MRKVLGGVVYDTDNSVVDKKFTFGAPGDPCGYEETLYITTSGQYFIYTNGGASSKYPAEEIYPIEHEHVRDWILSH
jgi:hypothetical protein